MRQSDTWREIGWPPARGRIRWVLIRGVVVSVGCYYFGASLFWSMALGLGVVILGLPLLVRRHHSEPRRSTDEPAPQPGARTNIEQVAGELAKRRGRVSPAALRRLQALSHKLLQLQGLDLSEPADRPAIEALVGPSAFVQLTAVHSRRGPSMRTYLHLLDVVESIDRAKTSSATTPAAAVVPSASSRRRARA